MAEGSGKILRPVQVLMDGERFQKKPNKPPGGSQKDFFAGDDAGFVRHREQVRSQLSGFAKTLNENGEPVGFLHVQMRETALAKSHRPLDRLFSQANKFALVGGDENGNLIVQGTPRALQELGDLIHAKAEETPRIKPHKITGNPMEVVSEYRSELGSIEEIRLHDKEDRISFETKLAIETLRRPDAIGSYVVDLFRIQQDIAGPGAVERAIARLMKTIAEIPGGIEIRPALSENLRAQLLRPTLALSVRLIRDPHHRSIVLPLELTRAINDEDVAVLSAVPAKALQPDLDLKRHEDLLSLLSEQSLVRAVHLPVVLDEGMAKPVTVGKSLSLPAPVVDFDYPVVGVIDGGIAKVPSLTPWITGSAGKVLPEERNESHGTFIAGLCAGAYHLNTALTDHLESVGVKVFDLDLFPRKDLRSSYYPDYETFFDQLDESVRKARDTANVRVINFSFACGPAQTGAYSFVAEAFDSIARKNNVIFVVSAGNLTGAEIRPTWPAKTADAIQMLAAQTGNQGIAPPAEAFHALTVGAVNPPGFADHPPLHPTTYTRRGPGTGFSRKPDLAHIGGVSACPETANRTGLISLAADGSLIENCGTSFATPLVASTLATLDQRLERKASRELLHALMIHSAKRVDSLHGKAIRHIAPEFVGFGMPLRADEMLEDAPHEITIVFDQVLSPDRVLDFDFVWPQCLMTDSGSCRGEVDMTIVYTPPIDRAFKDEALRVELDSHLRQEAIDPETGEITWGGQLDHDGTVTPPGTKKREKEMLKNGVKWSPIKRLSTSMPKGRGNSSNWRLIVEPLTRKAADFPAEGVRFALLMTIRDNQKKGPVNDQMRNMLLGRGITLSDIKVAARVRQQAAA